MNYYLGLDLGTNSVGFGGLSINQNEEFDAIIDVGTRIFQEGVEAKTGTPKNQKRRLMRGARKSLRRRHERRGALLKLLSEAGLLPAGLEGKDADAGVWNTVGNPWELRAKALDEKLSPQELSRVLLHLCKRRGFKSNRKSAANDEGRVLEAISNLQEKISAEQCRTLGEYLSKQQVRRNRAWLFDKKLPELFTNRQMYEDEFDLIWGKQRAFHSQVLTTELKVKVFKAIFFQRPLAASSHLIGACTFEPHRKRSPICYLVAQRVRL
jgi:CRISPR-associated endonuclease Csn1